MSAEIETLVDVEEILDNFAVREIGYSGSDVKVYVDDYADANRSLMWDIEDNDTVTIHRILWEEKAIILRPTYA